MFETIWILAKGLFQHRLARGVERASLAGMHRRRRHIAYPGMTMLTVVPGEEALAERTCMLDRVKSRREVRSVFERLELRLRVRVIVAYVRAAMALGDTQIAQQQRDRF